MLQTKAAFSGFSVNDLDKAENFYSEILGLKLSSEEMESIAHQLMICNTPNFSPEGKPTFFTLDSSKIENYFTR